MSEPNRTAASDELAALVPRPSRRSGVAVALVAAFALALAWFAPMVLRVEFSIPEDSDHGVLVGHWGVGGTPFLFEMGFVYVDTWPGVTIEQVKDISGARVAGAWLLGDTAAEEAALALDQYVDWDEDDNENRTYGMPAVIPQNVDALLADVEALGVSFDEPLPQRLERGEYSQLLVLWEITDCSAGYYNTYSKDYPDAAIGTDPANGIVATNGLGFSVSVALRNGPGHYNMLAGPFQPWSPTSQATLAKSGMCS
jgi:hypothetical protein